MMLKLDEIQDIITAVFVTMQRSMSQTPLTLILLKKKSQELCDKMKDADFQKKMVCATTQATLLVIVNL